MKKQILSEEFLKMQKLAGIINEAEYRQKKNLVENELSSKEQEIVDYILGENIEEGASEILSRLKTIAKKGALTLGIVSALLSSAPANAKPNIINYIKTEVPSIDINKLDKTGGKETTKDDLKLTLTNGLKSTNPHVLNFKDFSTDTPSTSWNYGANAGKSNATVGLSISIEKGSDTISIDIGQVPGKSTEEYKTILAAAKSLGGKVDQYSKSATISVSKDKTSDVINFVKSNINNLNN